MPAPISKPLIGLSADATADKFLLSRTYINAVEQAGGIPIILPCVPSLAAAYVAQCDAILFTGGDDPYMPHWGVPMHPKAKPMDPARQEFELALLAALDSTPAKPALGICLGMQLMGLHAGGRLNQHLPDFLPTADLHWDKRAHEISGELGRGTVNSHHRQALADPGAMRVIAAAPDGVIEAVRRDDRPFYLGVQWHPERTADPNLGLGIIRKLVEAARASAIR